MTMPHMYIAAANLSGDYVPSVSRKFQQLSGGRLSTCAGLCRDYAVHDII